MLCSRVIGIRYVDPRLGNCLGVVGVEVFPRRRVAILFLCVQTDNFRRRWLVGSCQRSVPDDDFEFVLRSLDARCGERRRTGDGEDQDHAKEVRHHTLLSED